MAKDVAVTFPHRYEPRDYQLPILEALDSGYKRAVQVWHRRAGKEKTCFAGIVSKKMWERVGSYFYVFPEFAQGRKILWDGTDKDGMRFLDHFPHATIESVNNTEMKIRVKNGSMVQVIGSDSFNSSLGTNPIGMVLSEYALQDPACWGYYRPILAENDGWAVFNFTPRGENHAYKLWRLAKADPKNWFTSLLTVDDTKAIKKEVLEQERREIVELHGDDALYQQEYYCSFVVPIAGAYYATHIQKAVSEGRVGPVPHEPSLAVDTIWDLGMNDKTSIWFVQAVGAELRLIDYMEGTGKGIPNYISDIRQQKPHYVFGKHVGPHDLNVRDLSVLDGKSRWDVAKELGFEFVIAPKLSVADGIDAVRSMFARCRFDEEKTSAGFNALKNYTKLYDEKRKTYLNVPYHNWASNAADAFRYLAVSLELKHQTKAAEEGDKYERKQQRRRSGGGGNAVSMLG